MSKRVRKTALQAVMSERWAITPDGLRTILAIANREGDIEALKAQLGGELPEAPSVEIRGGVAVVPISGPIFRYANLFTQFSGATSLEMLALDFQKAVEDPSVHSILLNVDSPGGQVNGTNEFSDMVHRANQTKPVHGYAGGTAASAGYWAISGCREIVIDDTACLGSIGVVATYTDYSKQDEARGIKAIEIVSSASPKKRPDPKTEEGREQIRAELDALADVFITKVAKHRGVSEETVRAEFGQGDVFIGAHAVKAGLADRLGSLEGLIEELENNHGGNYRTGMPTQPLSITGGIPMDLKELKEKHPELYASIVEDSKKAGHAEGLKEGIATGQEQEMARVKGVREALIPGHEALIEELVADGKTTPAEAAMKVNRAEAALRSTAHKDIKADSPAAPAAAETGDDDAEAKEEKDTVAAMSAGMKKS